jgi:Bacterial membrane protein YfhO
MTRPPNARTSLEANSSAGNRRSTLLSLAGLLALTLAMFGDLLFAGGTRVLGHQGADLFLQYYSWRDFGFRQLAKGNIALWNPHIFSGAPFFGEMQAALLYPPNWLFLLMPLAPAINWTIALNIFAIGAFTFFWMRVRGLHPVAGFFAGAVTMFSGPHFLHVFAGHLPQLAAMTWSPLIFCAIDGLFETRKPGWCLLGIFAVAMQILAGFPQYVFYTGIIAGFYSALRLVAQWDWRLAARLLGIYLGAAVLTAVQLLPAIEATNETVRGAPLPLDFASMFSLPPENFLTLLAPDFFGNITSYWGRCYLWETSLFVSVTGFVLAVYAAIYVERKTKWIPLAVIFAALLLALGAHTPLFRLLYNWAPGFDRFRATSKFIFPACLFLVLLAAMGLDRLFRRKKNEPGLTIGTFAAAALFAIAGLWAANTSAWQALMTRMQTAGETYLLPELYTNGGFVAKSQHTAAISLFLAAGVCALFGTLLLFHKREPRLLYGLVALGLLEMSWFAHAARPSFDSSRIVNAEEKSILEEHPGDYRIINLFNPNSAMSLGAFDIWGYDPDVVRRYAEFITWTQGGDPNNATLYVKFTRFDPLYAMLRLRYVFAWHANKLETAEAPVPPMPHLQLVSNYRVLQGRDAIFTAMRAETFDPARDVILEHKPEPRPLPAETAGSAHIVKSSTDSLTIEADVDKPAILLITDVYTPNWRAVSLPGSVQSKYQLLPANYIFRAVPLAAGHHLFRVEYAPVGFIIGQWISIVATALFLVTCARVSLKK